MTIPCDRLESVRTALINAIAACNDLQYRVEEALESREGYDDIASKLYNIRDLAEDYRDCLQNGKRAVCDHLREEGWQ